MNFNDNQLEKIVSLMTIYEISPNNNNIFNKDDIGQSFYVIDKGDLFIYNTKLLNNNNMFNDNNSLLINGDYSFGELCFLNQKEDIKRAYSISSLSTLKIYILNKEQFHKFLIYEKISIKTVDIKIIKDIELFKFFNTEELYFISKLTYIMDDLDVNEDFNIIKDYNIKFLSFAEFLNLNINVSKEDPRNVFLKLAIPNYSQKYLMISIHSIIEIFGINYKFNIIFRIFIQKIKSDLSLFNIISNNYIEIILLYSIFKYKFFEKESSLGIKLSSTNNFIILILEGSIQLYDKNNNATKYSTFDYINTNVIQNKTKIIFSQNSIIIHTKFDIFVEKVKNIIEQQSLVINKIDAAPFLSILNNDEILFVLNKIKIQKNKKGDVIISNEKECTKFYIILQGKVKHKSYNDKTIQKYYENDCFGELFLLDNINHYSKDNYIYTSSDTLITAELDRDDFFILLTNPKINDYIKFKMYLEDKSINYCDLYYLFPLYETRLGNLYLVHNGIFLYAIKSISKLITQKYENEKQYIVNKINILKSINYRFIVRMVTKFKNDNWYFLLMEYVTGIKLNDAIKYFPNIQMNFKLFNDYISFYSAIIFLIVDYLHKLKIIHRDLKFSNFIIEKDGYLKLMDTGSTKKILNGYAKTLLGTPHYIAPEVIEGLNYSFSADYYSIGISLYFLLYNKFPFGNEEKDTYKIYQDIINNKIIFDEINISESSIEKYQELILLINDLLIKEPSKRISNINEIKSNKFLMGFEWNLLSSKKLKERLMPKVDNKFNKEKL
jgi:CRP-like cAMP-binding protein